MSTIEKQKEDIANAVKKGQQYGLVSGKSGTETANQVAAKEIIADTAASTHPKPTK